MKFTNNRRQQGFTLIEMLVVMGIIALLGALGVMVFSAFQSDGPEQGAQSLQGWLSIAKQRALRDNGPRGIRLELERVQSSTNPPQDFVFCRKLTYIETPPDFTGGVVQTGTDPNSGSGFAQFSKDLSGGLGNATQLWPVQVGDFFLVATDAPRRITAMIDANTVQLDAPPPMHTPTSDYRIIRHARPVRGEETLSMPEACVIDIGTFDLNSNAFSSFRSLVSLHDLDHVDILFNPSGEVISQANRGKVILWVRNPDEGLNAREQTLITVYTRTGQIAAHEVDTSGFGDPYSFTRDFNASGQ